MDETGEKAVVINAHAAVTALLEEAASFCPAKCIAITKDPDQTTEA